MKGGNFERECIEENCDVEELAEVFDNVDVSEPIQLKYDKCSKIVTAGKILMKIYSNQGPRSEVNSEVKLTWPTSNGPKNQNCC